MFPDLCLPSCLAVCQHQSFELECLHGVLVVCVSLLRMYGFVCDTFRLYGVSVFDWIVTCDPVFSTTLYGTGSKCVENLSCFLCCKRTSSPTVTLLSFACL